MRTLYGLLVSLQLCIGWTSEDRSRGFHLEDRLRGPPLQEDRLRGPPPLPDRSKGLHLEDRPEGPLLLYRPQLQGKKIFKLLL